VRVCVCVCMCVGGGGGDWWVGEWLAGGWGGLCMCSNLLKDRNLKIIFKKSVTASQKTHFSLHKPC